LEIETERESRQRAKGSPRKKLASRCGPTKRDHQEKGGGMRGEPINFGAPTPHRRERTRKRNDPKERGKNRKNQTRGNGDDTRKREKRRTH